MEIATLIVPFASLAISLVPMFIFNKLGWKNSLFIAEVSMMAGILYSANVISFTITQSTFGLIVMSVVMISLIVVVAPLIVVIDFIGYKILTRFFPKLCNRIVVV